MEVERPRSASPTAATISFITSKLPAQLSNASFKAGSTAPATPHVSSGCARGHDRGGQGSACWPATRVQNGAAWRRLQSSQAPWCPGSSGRGRRRTCCGGHGWRRWRHAALDGCALGGRCVAVHAGSVQQTGVARAGKSSGLRSVSACWQALRAAAGAHERRLASAGTALHILAGRPLPEGAACRSGGGPAPAAAALPSASFSSTTWKRPRLLEAALSGSPAPAGPRWSRSTDSLDAAACQRPPGLLPAPAAPRDCFAAAGSAAGGWQGCQRIGGASVRVQRPGAPRYAQGRLSRGAVDGRRLALVHVKPAVPLQAGTCQALFCPAARPGRRPERLLPAMWSRGACVQIACGAAAGSTCAGRAP